MPTNKSTRGRRLTFDLDVRRALAMLIAEHGARGAREVAPVPISLGTLLRIAGEFGVKLKKGRRLKSSIWMHNAA